MRITTTLGLLTCLFIGGCGAPADAPEEPPRGQGDVIYQVGTLNSLLARDYEGTARLCDLMQHGSLGLGTVNHLDGEMVIADGTGYVIRDDGTTDTLDAETKLPFGVITPFDVDTTITLTSVSSFSEFQSRLDENVASSNRLYAFRVNGRIDRLETRSVSAQQPPYPSLENVIANQTRFTITDPTGTMVGFRIPNVFKGVNTTGHHAHYVTEDRKGGGHVLDLRASELTVQIDRSSSLQVDPGDSPPAAVK